MADAGSDSKNLKTLLQARQPLPAGLGTALGEFLRALHAWGATAPPVRTVLAQNTPAAKTWTWATYGRLAETLELFPQVLGAAATTLAAVAEAPPLPRAQRTLVHGDYWCGNVLLGADGKVTVVDWEMAREGFAWEDLAQMCAELYLPVHFGGHRDGATVLDAFLRGYGAVSDEEMAARAVVHFGVHLVVWPCRVSGWGDAEQIEECMRVGLEFIERGWAKDWGWVSESVLKNIYDGPL